LAARSFIGGFSYSRKTGTTGKQEKRRIEGGEDQKGAENGLQRPENAENGPKFA